MKEAMLYEKIDNKVRCNLCCRKCIIPNGGLGFCRVRKNDGGRLYSLVYGKACSSQVDPIEKKPLAFFHPGSLVMSVATVGCNFRCLYCCNWIISQEERISGINLPPEEIVKLAKAYNCQGISYTYTEPTIFFEYMYDTAKIAHREGLFNTIVSNGYMSPEAVEVLIPYLDAATIDFKGAGNPEFYKKFASVPDVKPIYECLKRLRKGGVHVEVTNLVVPKYGDSTNDIRELSVWIRENLGADTPFHLLRFHPEYKLTSVPSTPVETLERAYMVAVQSGLKYVLLGNIPGHRFENTYCPSCGELLIERYGFYVERWNLTGDNKCPSCGEKTPVKGTLHKARGGIFPIF